VPTIDENSKTDRQTAELCCGVIRDKNEKKKKQKINKRTENELVNTLYINLQ
jgi:hypothetical protein